MTPRIKPPLTMQASHMRMPPSEWVVLPAIEAAVNDLGKAVGHSARSEALDTHVEETDGIPDS